MGNNYEEGKEEQFEMPEEIIEATRYLVSFAVGIIVGILVW